MINVWTHYFASHFESKRFSELTTRNDDLYSLIKENSALPKTSNMMFLGVLVLLASLMPAKGQLEDFELNMEGKIGLLFFSSFTNDFLQVG